CTRGVVTDYFDFW
nr:immunoglobulin heavy chain junction region [Mus musculus]